MKAWMLEYFTIPRKERLGIISLVGLIALAWLVPFLWKHAEKADAHYYISKAESVSVPVAGIVKPLHVFDPNSIGDDEWLELGVPERSVKMIRNYLNKGGRFRKPDALMTIYGMDTSIAKALMPYVKIEGRTTISSPASNNIDLSSIDPRFRKPEKKSIPILDINVADSAALEALPWVGEKTASRIIKFRDACGGLYTIDQLAGIYGVSDTAFLHFRSYLRIGKKEIRRLNVNTATVDSLAGHPYMQYRQAKTLVAYRTQHGLFKNSQDLLSIPIFDRAWLDKIEPYLIF